MAIKRKSETDATDIGSSYDRCSIHLFLAKAAKSGSDKILGPYLADFSTGDDIGYFVPSAANGAEISLGLLTVE